jgi:hypothetical protein
VCSYCEKPSTSLMTCPCREAFYCSGTCQERHWVVHTAKCSAKRKGQKVLRSCAFCSNASYSLRSCVCGAVLYCDPQCQGAHWGTHRRTCTSWITTFKKSKTRFKEVGTQTALSWFDEADEIKVNRKPADTVAVYVDEGPIGEDGRRRINRRGKLLINSPSDTNEQSMDSMDARSPKLMPISASATSPVPTMLVTSPATGDNFRSLEVEEETVRGALQGEWRLAHTQLCKAAQSPINAMFLLEVEEGERRARVKIVSQFNTWHETQRPPTM